MLAHSYQPPWFMVCDACFVNKTISQKHKSDILISNGSNNGPTMRGYQNKVPLLRVTSGMIDS